MRAVEYPTTCPHCGTHHDCVTEITGDAAPNPGDVTLCFYCGNWAIFDDDAPGGLRQPTKLEQREIAANPRLRSARAAWQKVKA